MTAHGSNHDIPALSTGMTIPSAFHLKPKSIERQESELRYSQRKQQDSNLRKSIKGLYQFSKLAL